MVTAPSTKVLAPINGHSHQQWSKPTTMDVAPPTMVTATPLMVTTPIKGHSPPTKHGHSDPPMVTAPLQWSQPLQQCSQPQLMVTALAIIVTAPPIMVAAFLIMVRAPLTMVAAPTWADAKTFTLQISTEILDFNNDVKRSNKYTPRVTQSAESQELVCEI